MSRGLIRAAKIVGTVVAIAAAIPTGGGSTLLAGALGVSASTAGLIAAGTAFAINTVTSLADKPPGSKPLGSSLIFKPWKEQPA
jgi:hypothetical protein